MYTFSEYTGGYDSLFGYITSGHGMKGKHEKMITDVELSDLCKTQKKKKRTLLWLKCVGLRL